MRAAGEGKPQPWQGTGRNSKDLVWHPQAAESQQDLAGTHALWSFSSQSLHLQSLFNKRKILSNTNQRNRNCNVTYLTDMQIMLHDLLLYRSPRLYLMRPLDYP